MEFKLISVKQAILKTLRDLGISDEELFIADAVEWAAEALEQIDAYTQYEEVLNYELEVVDYMTKLPHDFYSIAANPNLNYKIQGDSLITDKRSGKIKINYLAFVLDEEGWLMIPDNISYKEAIMWKIATKLAMRGQLPNPVLDLRYCEAKWNFYCTQARSKANQLTADQQERFAANRLRFKPDVRQYGVNFHRISNPMNRK